MASLREHGFDPFIDLDDLKTSGARPAFGAGWPPPSPGGVSPF